MGIAEIAALVFFVSMTFFAVGAQDWMPSYEERQARKCDRRAAKLKARADWLAECDLHRRVPDVLQRARQIEEEAKRWRNHDKD